MWLLGRTNALAAKLFASGGDYALDGEKLAVDRESMPLAGHSAVIVRRHPGNLEKAIGWIFADGTVPLPGLGRKLPHYGKYSYLGFEGDEPVNVLKGQWTATDSPLRVDLRPNAERAAAVAALALPARKALAELPPVFSQKALLDHVAWLSAAEREGRGVGTKGLDAAAEYVAAAFKAMGLQPGGDGGTYFQSFPSPKSPSGAAATLRNVIGVLPGSKAEWAGQSALLTAHYDHLGLGWPDVHKGDEGKLHPGADDNASGVAVMLELAKALASGEKPQRTIVFVAFTGEESGLLGSKHYVEHPAFPLDEDDRRHQPRHGGPAVRQEGVGDRHGQRLGVAAHLPRRGLRDRRRGPDDPGRPRVVRPEELHRQGRARGADLHRPARGLSPARGHRRQDRRARPREGGDLREGGDRLPRRARAAAHEHDRVDEGCARRGLGRGRRRRRRRARGGGGQGRRVSFGTMPDFAFAGPGVKVAGVTPGSPAEKAGVKEGDVLLKIDGKDVANLQGFSGLLRGLTPGQTVKVVLLRGGQEQTLDVTVVER